MLGTTLLETLRQGTHGTIDDFTLMKRANQDLAAGLNLTDDQFSLLVERRLRPRPGDRRQRQGRARHDERCDGHRPRESGRAAHRQSRSESG
jgi:hypothetical protein